MHKAGTIGRFLRTPKGLLLAILAPLAGLAATAEGTRLSLRDVAIAVTVAALIDLVALRSRKHAWEFPSGAILTGLIVAMILTPHERWYVIAATSAIAIVSKYVFRFRSANLLNPAALALVASFYVFGSAQSWWGALPQWPAAGIAIVAAVGVVIADRVNRLPLMLAFLAVYFLLFTVAAFVGAPAHVAEIYRAPDVHAALYFACFIVTDPPTSPWAVRDQILCAAIVAAVSFGAFEWTGAACYLLIGVLAGNVWEGWRRMRFAKRRTYRSAVAVQTAP